MWMLSLGLAATQGGAKVNSIIRSMNRLDIAECSPEDWEGLIRQPSIALSRSTLPALSELGRAVGVVFIGIILDVLCHIPKCAVTGDYSWLVFTIAAVAAATNCSGAAGRRIEPMQPATGSAQRPALRGRRQRAHPRVSTRVLPQKRE